MQTFLKGDKNKELCDAVNHIAVKTIGAWAADNNSNVIHISTDYVFDGISETSLKKTDTPDPINVYGISR